MQSPKIKRAIREVVEEQEQLNYSRRMGAQWVLDVSHLNVNWNKPYLTEAPYLIVVMKHVWININLIIHNIFFSLII